MANEVVIVVKGSDQFSSTADKVNKSATGMGSTLASVGKIAGGFVLAQGILKAPSAIGDVIGAASDMNETMSKSSIVFGESNADILKWASTAATSMGLSKQKTLEATATFGNFLTAMGQTKPVAADMSKAMVTLANDLGSFNNADPEEVLLALRSGLSGEIEPMRRFGVAIDDAAVKAKAMEMGLGAVGRELTQQEKIQARYKLIMEQTTTAQGDFTRTQDGLANQSKILGAQWEDLKAQIGAQLLPVVLQLVTVMNENLPGAISATSNAFETARPVIQTIFENVKAGFEVIRPALEWVINNKVAMTAALTAIGLAAVLAFTPVTLPILAVVAGLVGLMFTIGLVSRHWDEIKAKTIEVWDGIKAYLNENFGILVLLATFYFEMIKNQITTAINIVRDVIKIVLALIHGDWGEAWEGVKQLAADIWEGIKTDIGLKLGLIRDIIVFALTFAKNVAVDVMNQAKDGIVGAWQSIKDSVTGFIDDIIDKIQELIDKAKSLLNIGGIAGKVLDSAASALGFAEGGITPGGMVLVGERGPELVDLPPGSRVHSNTESRQMMTNPRANVGGNTTINVYPQQIILQGDPQAAFASLSGMV